MSEKNSFRSMIKETIKWSNYLSALKGVGFLGVIVRDNSHKGADARSFLEKLSREMKGVPIQDLSSVNGHCSDLDYWQKRVKSRGSFFLYYDPDNKLGNIWEGEAYTIEKLI